MSDLPHPQDAISRLKRLSEPVEQAKLQSDAELLALYVEGGCRDAIETLIERYAPMVASVCRLTVADPASAEDAFQATFLVLLKSARKIRRQSSVAAWLHGVAYRTASRIRKKGRQQLSHQSCDDVIKHCDLSDDPVAQLARKMELETLDRELEGLPERLRAPLVEHYLLGYSAPQIAERMDLSTAAVEGRLKRGRRALRTMLARRGISLSVLVAGSSLFQEHLQAAQASHWSASFVESHLPTSDSPMGDAVQADPPSPDVLSLVRGELTMISAGAFKTSLATGILLLGGAFAVFATDRLRGDSQGNARHANLSGSAGEPMTLPALETTQEIAAQFGAPGGATQQATTGGANRGGTQVQSGLGFGGSAPAGGQPGGLGEIGVENTTGLGGGGGVVGGRGGPQPPASSSGGSKEEITWERPQSAGNSVPVWLAGGQASMEAMENNRAVLAQDVAFDFKNTSLLQVADWLSTETGVQFEVNLTECDLLGVDPETPIRSSGHGSVREFLRRSLDPLELTYLVTESTIEITSKDAAEAHASMRFYDLAYILPNPSHSDAVVNAIQQSIDQDGWLAAGGMNSIVIVGSMMIVSAPDTTQQKIEILLMNLSRMNPKNMENAPPVYNGMGGISGGMGGMGGGVGGGGGFF